MASFENSTYTNHTKYLASKKKHRETVKARNREYLNQHRGTCLFCGCGDDIQQHHYNPALGKKSKSYLMGCSVKALQKELDKCWSLCNDCHIKLHRRMVDPLPICYDC